MTTFFFLQGDKVKNTMREREGVVVGMETETLALVDYGRGPEKASVKNLELVSKGTDVQQALRKDPEALESFAEHFKRCGGRIEITCQPSKASMLASELSSVSKLSELDAADYIRETTEASHAAKFDILVDAGLPVGLSDRLGVFFHVDGLRARHGEVQVNSRPLAEWLLWTHNVTPRKWNNN